MPRALKRICMAALASLWLSGLFSPLVCLAWAGQAPNDPLPTAWGGMLLLWGSPVALALLAIMVQSSQGRDDRAGREGESEILAQALDSLPHGICILDPDLKIIRANRWLEQRYGRGGSLKGQVCHRALHGLEGPCPQCPAQRALASGQPQSHILPAPGNGEASGRLELTAYPVRNKEGEINAVVEYVRDIGEPKTAQEGPGQRTGEMARLNRELTRAHDLMIGSRNKLKTVFDSMTEPIYAVTPDGTMESVNLAAASLSGAHPRELAGLPFVDFVARSLPSPSLKEHCQESFNRMLASKKPQWGLVTAPGEGGNQYYEVTHTPVFDENGEVTHGIAQIKDVTEFRRMERTIREYSESLEQKVAERTSELTQANQELKRLDQLRHDLTNMVVHDMKGPLAELMGNLELLGYQIEGEDSREPLDLAVLGAEDLLRMIMNLLDIDRLEEDRLKVGKAPLSFAELAGSVRDKFKTLIRLMGLNVEIQDRTQEAFPGDPGLLARVLQNLLTNAFTHTPEGGAITIRGAEAEDKGVVLEVADTGGGIPAAYQGRIFEKFTQAEPGSGPRTSTGLGLTFCKLAVEAHGGRIWFESQTRKGTTFFIWLPRD